MSEHLPNAIVTDQCKAMKRKIAKYSSQVVPMEHNKKIRKQLRGYSQYESIKKVLQNSVYDSLIVEDFEARWARIVSEYYLVVNERLRGLYKE